MSTRPSASKKPAIVPATRFAISYLRFSHVRQSRGDSIRRQQAAFDAYIKRHGLTLLDAFTDKGVSGFRGKHATKGDLARLIDLVDGGKIPRGTTLIIENIDRLSREPMMGALNRFTHLIHKGIDVVCLDFPDKVFSTDRINEDPSLLSTLIMMMQRGHNESKVKSTRGSESYTARFDQARIDKKVIKGYRGPAWLSVENRYFVENPARCDVVREIYRLRIAGLGDYAIAQALNKREVPIFDHCAKRKTATKETGWYPSYIADILSTRAVLGEFDPRSAGNPFIYFPEVVSPSVFAEAQAAKRCRNTSVKGARGSKHHNLFQGLTKCAHCGGSMTVIQNRPDEGGRPAIRYLWCSNRRRHAASCEGSGMVNLHRIEKAVLDYLPQIPWSEIVRMENPDDPIQALDTEISRLKDEIAVLKTKNDNLANAVAQASQSLPALLDMMNKVANEMAHAEALLKRAKADRATKIAATRPGLVKDAIGFAKAMETATDLDRYEARARLSKALSGIITRIDCDSKQKLVAVHISKSYTLLVFPAEKGEAAVGFFKSKPSPVEVENFAPGVLMNFGKGQPSVYLFGATPVEAASP